MNIKLLISSFVTGIIFAIGLALSGMTSPHKVIGFLNITGDWDPTLAFVMIGAIPVHLIAYRLVKHRTSPLFDISFSWPTRYEITPQLVMGSSLFGIGWGIAGFCPGPAVTSVFSGNMEPLIFVFMMLAGMMLYKILEPTIPFRK